MAQSAQSTRIPSFSNMSSGQPEQTNFSWITSQIGARQHYGVARGFLYKSDLRLMYTDAWCRFGRELIQRGPVAARAFAGRYHPDIPNSRVVSFNLSTLVDRIRFGGDHL